MRKSILFLLLCIFLLTSNIIAYSLSENYRFLIKKLKYPSEVVYDDTETLSDVKQVEIKKDSSGNIRVEEENSSQNFFEGLTGIKLTQKEDTLPELLESELFFLDIFQEKYSLQEIQFSNYLFDITGEYPDPYYEYYSKDLTLYIFPTKNYIQIRDIFELLTFDLPFTLNEVNNFGQASFFINMTQSEMEPQVRLVIEYQNKVFGLKIKKDRYNEVKELLKKFNI